MKSPGELCGGKILNEASDTLFSVRPIVEVMLRRFTVSQNCFNQIFLKSRSVTITFFFQPENVVSEEWSGKDIREKFQIFFSARSILMQSFQITFRFLELPNYVFHNSKRVRITFPQQENAVSKKWCGGKILKKKNRFLFQ